MAGGHITSIDSESVAVVMVGTPQKLRRVRAIAPAVAILFGLQAVDAQAHVRAGSIVSRIPVGASVPHGRGTARAPRTRAVAPRTSSWPARGRALAGPPTIPAAPAPGISTTGASPTGSSGAGSSGGASPGASPGGASPATAGPIVTTPSAGGSPPSPSPTTGPPAVPAPTAGAQPAGGTSTTGTSSGHHPTGAAHRTGPHPNGTVRSPVATQPVATQPVATQPAATSSAASQPQGTPQPAAPTPAPAAGGSTAPGPVATPPVATPPVATSPVAPPAVANLSGSVKRLNRLLAHLLGADGASIRPLGPQLLALRALTTQLMRAGDEAAGSLQPALFADSSTDGVLPALSSSSMDTTSGLAGSVRSLEASTEQGNDLAPHRRPGEVPSIAQLVPVPAPSAQGGPSTGGAAAGLSGGIGTTGPPSIALVAMLALAVSILLSRRFVADPGPWRSIVLPLQLERPG